MKVSRSLLAFDIRPYFSHLQSIPQCMLTVHNVFRYLPGGSGAFRPEVLPGKEDRSAPFQDAAIDTGVGQIGQVLEFNQLQAEGDDHRPAAVNDEKHQLLLAVYLYSGIWIS